MLSSFCNRLEQVWGGKKVVAIKMVVFTMQMRSPFGVQSFRRLYTTSVVKQHTKQIECSFSGVLDTFSILKSYSSGHNHL